MYDHAAVHYLDQTTASLVQISLSSIQTPVSLVQTPASLVQTPVSLVQTPVALVQTPPQTAVTWMKNHPRSTRMNSAEHLSKKCLSLQLSVYVSCFARGL